VLVVYDTMTGNTKKFVNKLPYKSCHISEYDGFSPFILVTYTMNFGEIPETTKHFMELYNHKCKGVSSSGNKIWGKNFGIAANKITTRFGVPFISKFELQGTDEDVRYFVERANKLCFME